MNENVKINNFNIKIKSFFRRVFLDKVIIAYLLVLLLFVAGEIFLKGFLTFSHVMAVLQASFFVGIIALAQTFVVISGKEDFDLSVGATLTVGVLLGAAILNGKNTNIFYALIAVLIAGFIFGTINGLGIAYLGISPLIMTLALAMVIEGILLFVTKGFLYGKASSVLELIGKDFLNIKLFGHLLKIPWVNIIWLVLLLLSVLILNRTRVGLVLRGVGSNIRAAELLGVRVKMVKTLVYSFSGMVSAFMGLLLLGYVGTPNISLGLGHKINYPMLSIIAVIIGGIGGGHGSYVGAVAGSIFVVTLNSILTTLGFDDGSRMAISGVVLLILLIAYTRRSKNI